MREYPFSPETGDLREPRSEDSYLLPRQSFEYEIDDVLDCRKSFAVVFADRAVKISVGQPFSEANKYLGPVQFIQLGKRLLEPNTEMLIDSDAYYNPRSGGHPENCFEYLQKKVLYFPSLDLLARYLVRR